MSDAGYNVKIMTFTAVVATIKLVLSLIMFAKIHNLALDPIMEKFFASPLLSQIDF